MNQRQQNKKKKNHTKKFHNAVVKQLREQLNISITEQSFLHDITSFTVPLLTDWVFRFSNDFYSREDSVMYLYGDHKSLIDKFTPSRCFISFTNVEDFLSAITQLQANLPYYTVNALAIGRTFLECEELDDTTVTKRFKKFQDDLVASEEKKHQIIKKYTEYAKHLIGYRGPNYIITATGIQDINLHSQSYSYDRFALGFCCTDLDGNPITHWTDDFTEFVDKVAADVENLKEMTYGSNFFSLNMEVTYLYTTLPALRKSSHYPVNRS